MRFYIFGDNSAKNISNSKKVFKKSKYNAVYISFDQALLLFDRYVAEKRYKNLYLIMDIFNSEKSTKQYDLDDIRMNWILVEASINYGEICYNSDCLYMESGDSYIDFKTNRSMVKTYLNNNTIHIKFSDKGITYERIIPITDNEYDNDIEFIQKEYKNVKGKFIVDYRKYKELPQQKRIYNVKIKEKLKEDNITINFKESIGLKAVKQIKVPSFLEVR